jgi:hypothetical protein
MRYSGSINAVSNNRSFTNYSRRELTSKRGNTTTTNIPVINEQEMLESEE